MYTLGICNDETASACLFKSGKLIAAVSEERFTRIKQDNTFPKKSIKFVLDFEKIKISDITTVAYSWFKGMDYNLVKNYLKRIESECGKNPFAVKTIYERVSWEIKQDEKKKYEFEAWVHKHLPKKTKVVKYFHHEAHAASASLLSKFNEGLVITCDARGDFESLTISLFNRRNKNPLKKIFSSNSIDSLGFFYGRITGLLGYKPMRHEGKITGLAAFGNSKKAIHLMKKMINYRSGNIEAHLGDFFKPFFQPYSNKLVKEIKKFRKEDIAAAAQSHIEDCLIKLTNYYIDKYKIKKTNLMLSGGVFGNVKINYKLKSLERITNVYVQPQMSDGGLCLGAGVLEDHKNNLRIKPMLNADLGPKPIPIKLNKLEGFKSRIIKKNLEDEISSQLANSKVIGIVRGRMEFGPRALCKRSIIYKTSDNTINDWLNKRMSRTEFMPFAPIVREEIGKKAFLDFDPKDLTLKFMTSTIRCSQEFIKKCPAVCHVDKTARPQIISKKDDPFIWKLLISWEKKSGELALVNTSFNSHEEPIICSNEDALRALKKNVIDILYIENVMITLR